MRHRKGKQRRKGWLRAAALLLTVCLLAGGLPAGGRAAAASEVLQHGVLQQENAAAYEIFLADFLSQDPRLRSDLSLEMLHRRLNTAMDEEEGFRQTHICSSPTRAAWSLTAVRSCTSRFCWKFCANRRPAATRWKRPGKAWKYGGILFWNTR